MQKKRKIFSRIILWLLLLGTVCAVFVLFANLRIYTSAKSRIVSVHTAADFGGDCILVLGAGVRKDGTPSDMLEDRLNTALSVFETGAAPKLLMSGDHGRKEYNEVQVMKNYAVDHGAASEDVFMDHAGFSTYESLYRARDIFKAQKVIIVSQGYHLYRALYIAEALGVEAVGVSADLRPYAGQSMREIREIAARTKDFVNCMIQPKPTYLGDTIPVNGNGNITND